MPLFQLLIVYLVFIAAEEQPLSLCEKVNDPSARKCACGWKIYRFGARLDEMVRKCVFNFGVLNIFTSALWWPICTRAHTLKT